jgi:glycerol-3-phosphate dehydrogenase
MENCDVAIIGAGSSGASIARELSRYKLDIVLLDRENDVAMGATKANSGIVHGGYAEDSGLLKGRLCYKGRKEFPRLQEELNFGFRETGSLVLSFSDDRAALLPLYENGLRNGLEDLEIIDAKGIKALEPHAHPEAKWALHCRGAGVCSPYEYAIALVENAVANGVSLRLSREVVSIARDDEGFVLGCREGGEGYRARIVVNCCGVDAGHVCDLTGQGYFGITPRSGEFMILGRGSGSDFKKVLFRLPTPMGKGILVTPTYHGNLLLGPDARDEAEIDRSTHIERLRFIADQAKLTAAGFDIRQFIRSFTGVRAVSSTHDFIIEEGKIPGFINVAGIQSPGLTSSPAIAALVVELVGRKIRLEEKPAFDPFRKPIIVKKELLPFSEIASLVDIPPAPERIVCRCEQVRESEIVDALHRGVEVTTVDGVKRRTRAGMGYCQGGFCRPRVAEVMERELGVAIDPRDDVAHSGLSRVGRADIASLLG